MYKCGNASLGLVLMLKCFEVTLFANTIPRDLSRLNPLRIGCAFDDIGVNISMTTIPASRHKMVTDAASMR